MSTHSLVDSILPNIYNEPTFIRDLYYQICDIVDESYNDGYQEGYSDGHIEGRDVGFDEGYAEGVNDATR